MKKRLLSLALLLAVTIAFSMILSGCSFMLGSFVGEYSSVFVDSQNADGTISFELSIKNDNTFILSRTEGESVRSYTGGWEAYSSGGERELLCMIDVLNENDLKGWSPYFTLCFTEGDHLMAEAGMSCSYGLTETAFGYGNTRSITLILFEEK